jgi:hypothetical protein
VLARRFARNTSHNQPCDWSALVFVLAALAAMVALLMLGLLIARDGDI